MSGGGIARSRLAEERKAWRKNHPHGFVAKPETAADGSLNLMVWHCSIPGKPGTDWEGGNYPLTLLFSEDYPSKPQSASSLKGWRPAITVKQILVGIQDLLDSPKAADPAQTDGYQLFIQDPAEYKRRVRQQSKLYPPLI